MHFLWIPSSDDRLLLFLFQHEIIENVKVEICSKLGALATFVSLMLSSALLDEFDL
jgi:hypothetical protein